MYLFPLKQQNGCQRTTQTSRQALSTRKHSKGDSTRKAKRPLHTAVRPVDWGEGEGADVKRIAGIIVQLHRIAPALFTRHHDLLRLSGHLQGTRQARSAVLHLLAAGAAAAKCSMAPLSPSGRSMPSEEERGTQRNVEVLPKLNKMAEKPEVAARSIVGQQLGLHAVPQHASPWPLDSTPAAAGRSGGRCRNFSA